MQLEFGWFLPTFGDTTAYGLDEANIPADPEMFTRVAQSAEKAGFSYILIPVRTNCWDAYMTGAYVAAKTNSISPLIAARAGFMAPTVMAKMFSTLDNLTGGRVKINLITGGSVEEMAADGLFEDHDSRYKILSEAVSVMRRAWAEDTPFDFEGEFFQAKGIDVRPKPTSPNRQLQMYLGGLSEAAQELSAREADVQLFWGDTPEAISKRIYTLKERAEGHGREINFGMRLQIIVRETSEEAWQAAEDLIHHVDVTPEDILKKGKTSAVGESRTLELGKAENYMIGKNLWSGLAAARGGAGIAIVGNPDEVEDTLRQFIEIGCRSFCLGGFPHDEEATRFGELVMPRFYEEMGVSVQEIAAHS